MHKFADILCKGLYNYNTYDDNDDASKDDDDNADDDDEDNDYAEDNDE